MDSVHIHPDPPLQTPVARVIERDAGWQAGVCEADGRVPRKLMRKLRDAGLPGPMSEPKPGGGADSACSGGGSTRLMPERTPEPMLGKVARRH